MAGDFDMAPEDWEEDYGSKEDAWEDRPKGPRACPDCYRSYAHHPDCPSADDPIDEDDSE